MFPDMFDISSPQMACSNIRYGPGVTKEVGMVSLYISQRLLLSLSLSVSPLFFSLLSL